MPFLVFENRGVTLKVYHESLVYPFGSSNVKMPQSSSKGGGKGKHGKNAKVRGDA
jgi:hypothetical protein